MDPGVSKMSESPTIDFSRVGIASAMSTMDVDDDATTYTCKCGLVYLSRQGLHRHITKMRDHEQHRRIEWI